MRTRTLLLLAVTCGLAILVAGGIQLLRIANQDQNTALGAGDKGTAGVDDPNGLTGFTLVGVPKPVAAVQVAGAANACKGFTVQAVTCTITFPTDGFTTKDRQLLFIRAEEHVRWRLV